MSCSVLYTSTMHLSYLVFTIITMVNITKFTKVTFYTSYLYCTPITFCVSTITMVNISQFTDVALCTVYLYHASITFCVHHNHNGLQYSHYHYSSYTGDQCYFLTYTSFTLFNKSTNTYIYYIQVAICRNLNLLNYKSFLMEELNTKCFIEKCIPANLWL